MDDLSDMLEQPDGDEPGYIESPLDPPPEPDAPPFPGVSVNSDPTEPETNQGIAATQREIGSIEGITGDPRLIVSKTYDPTAAIWGDPEDLGKIYGEPENGIKFWHQQEFPDTCAIVSQEFILEDITGDDFSEEDLVKESRAKGYYYPGCGTLPYDVGKLLEDYDISVQRSEGNSIEDIKEKLDNNQKIIVGVDANEIWANGLDQQLIDLFYMPEANHAVQVIGYNEDNGSVILNDPGHPDGKGLEVPLVDFQCAWDDSNSFMVSTLDENTLSSLAPGAAVSAGTVGTITGRLIKQHQKS